MTYKEISLEYKKKVILLKSNEDNVSSGLLYCVAVSFKLIYFDMQF